MSESQSYLGCNPQVLGAEIESLLRDNEILRRSVHEEHAGAARAYQQVVSLRAKLSQMLEWFGNPKRDEWLSDESWKMACKVCEDARAAISKSHETSRKEEG